MSESLNESFQQSRRELWVMLGTWIVFFLWVTIYCKLNAFSAPGETVPLLWGFPKWVLFGIAAPWVLANIVTVVFSMAVMKDTDLRGDDDAADVEVGE